MASSRKDFLNRYATLGFRQSDTKSMQAAVRLEIQERQEQYQELKKEIEDRPSQNNNHVCDYKQIENNVTKNKEIIKKLEAKISALENQINSLLKVNKTK